MQSQWALWKMINYMQGVSKCLNFEIGRGDNYNKNINCLKSL